MKNIILKLTILILLCNILSAHADYTAINTVEILAQSAASVIVGGNYKTTIDPQDGNLLNYLTVDFTVSSNEAINNLQLRAIINDNNAVSYSSFTSNDITPNTNANMYMVLASSSFPPTADAIADCKSGSSTAENNPNSIAYPGTINITNNGNIQYSTNADDSQGYFICNLQEGDTDINLSLGVIAKTGTYSSTSSLDCDDTFIAEIYLDNIP